MKYIKFKNLGFVLFSEAQQHKDIAKLIGDEIESAGFAKASEFIDGGKIQCFGESLSLRASCQKTDTYKLQSQIYNL